MSSNSELTTHNAELPSPLSQPSPSSLQPTAYSLRSRSAFARAHFLDRHGNPWQPRAYQLPSLESNAPRKVHCDGRDVGKTAEIELITCWAILNCPRQSMLIATQCENHLFPLMHRLARRFNDTPVLKAALLESRRHSQQQPRQSPVYIHTIH